MTGYLQTETLIFTSKPYTRKQFCCESKLESLHTHHTDTHTRKKERKKDRRKGNTEKYIIKLSKINYQSYYSREKLKAKRKKKKKKIVMIQMAVPISIAPPPPPKKKGGGEGLSTVVAILNFVLFQMPVLRNEGMQMSADQRLTSPLYCGRVRRVWYVTAARSCPEVWPDPCSSVTLHNHQETRRSFFLFRIFGISICSVKTDMERGSVRRSSFKGREKAIVNETNIETALKATLGKLLRDGVERMWAFPSA